MTLGHTLIQHFSSMSLAVIFCHSAQSLYIASVSLSPRGLAAFLCHMKCYPKLPQYLGKLKCNLPVFHCFLCMCNHVMHCRFCGLNWFVVRLVDVQGHKPNDLPLICLATNFCMIFSMKNSRLMGWYPQRLDVQCEVWEEAMYFIPPTEVLTRAGRTNGEGRHQVMGRSG